MRTLSPTLIWLALIAMTVPVASGAEPFTITIPGQGWTVAFDSPPLMKFLGQSNGKDFSFRATSGESGFNLSLFVEEPKTKNQATHEACFSHYWPLAKQNPLIEEDSVKTEKTDNYVKVSYDLTVGKDETSPHVNYYFVFKDRWIDVHVSRFPSAADDKEIFAAFEKSLTYKTTKDDSKAK